MAKVSTSEPGLAQAVLSADYFSLFGLPARQRLDPAALEVAWHQLQGEVHPDRHAHLDEHSRRQALQLATRVNEAYQVLRKPRSRARYLLECAGVDVGAESNTAMPADFLCQQLEWREALDEGRQNPAVLEALAGELSIEVRTLEEALASALDDDTEHEHGHAEAAGQLRRLMFVDRLQQEVDDALFAIGG